MADRYSIYAIAYGIDPSTQTPVKNLKFSSWKSCAPYVTGINEANFKGFYTNIEADAWLAKQGGRPRAKRNSKKSEPQQAVPSSSASKETQNASSDPYMSPRDHIKAKFLEKCVKLSVDPNSVMYYLMLQWINMTDFIHVAEETPVNEDDEEEIPLF